MSALGYITVLVLGLSCIVTAMPEEKRLTKHILDNYMRVGKVGRPGSNVSEPTKVNISFGLIELEDFDIVNQQLVMVGWTAMEWEDGLLQWDPSDFGGVDQIAVDSASIWVPDVILSNSLSQPQPIHETRTHVTSEGKITWVTTYKYHFFCKIATEKMDGNTFPCYLKFASWSMSSSSLLLSNKIDRFDAKYLITHREWEFFRNRASKQEVELPWGNGMKTSEVTYDFTLKRREEENKVEHLNNSGPVAHLTSGLLIALLLCSYTARSL